MTLSFKICVLISSLLLTINTSFAENKTDKNPLTNISQQVTLPLKYYSFDTKTNKIDIENLFGTKIIQLMKIIPSKEMILRNKEAVKKMNENGGEMDYTNGIIPFNNSPGAIDLGMANVPVLDQGSYGTCVTFSTIGALDAKFNLGDYIDPQCSLALDLALGNNWWNYAYAPSDIMNPLKQNGIIPKNECFGSVYPDPNQILTQANYQSQSYKGYSNYITYHFEATPNLDHVKAVINNGNRILIGTFLSATNDSISVDGFDMFINLQKTNGGL